MNHEQEPGLTPEQLLMIQQALAAQEESEKREISRGQFMVQLEKIMDYHEERYDAAQDVMIDAKKHILKIYSVINKVRTLEDSGYRIVFFIDREGNASYSAAAKESLGFRTPTKEGGE